MGSGLTRTQIGNIFSVLSNLSWLFLWSLRLDQLAKTVFPLLQLFSSKLIFQSFYEKVLHYVDWLITSIPLYSMFFFYSMNKGFILLDWEFHFVELLQSYPICKRIIFWNTRRERGYLECNLTSHRRSSRRKNPPEHIALAALPIYSLKSRFFRFITQKGLSLGARFLIKLLLEIFHVIS